MPFYVLTEVGKNVVYRHFSCSHLQNVVDNLKENYIRFSVPECEEPSNHVKATLSGVSLVLPLHSGVNFTVPMQRGNFSRCLIHRFVGIVRIKQSYETATRPREVTYGTNPYVTWTPQWERYCTIIGEPFYFWQGKTYGMGGSHDSTTTGNASRAFFRALDRHVALETRNHHGE